MGSHDAKHACDAHAALAGVRKGRPVPLCHRVRTVCGPLAGRTRAVGPVQESGCWHVALPLDRSPAARGLQQRSRRHRRKSQFNPAGAFKGRHIVCAIQHRPHQPPSRCSRLHQQARQARAAAPMVAPSRLALAPQAWPVLAQWQVVRQAKPSSQAKQLERQLEARRAQTSSRAILTVMLAHTSFPF